MSYTKTLSDYAVELRYEDLPKDVIEQVKFLTLHTLGVSLAAYPTGQGGRAIALAKDMGGRKEESTILGDGGKVSCTQAGFANGTLADILDWEDCSWTGHPSSNVIPAALAVGERVEASGEEYITSVVAGYELHERIAMAVQPPETQEYFKGWGLTSWVIYGAAVPAAKLLELDKEEMENLIGIAGAFTPIVNNKVYWSRSDLYHYQWGMNCMKGISAALIAKSGISPLPDFLDGKDGYWVTIADECNWDWYNKDLGKRYLIMETLYKHWPTNMWIQQHLDALDAIIKKDQIQTKDIEQIIVRPDIRLRMAYKPEGYKSIVDAEFSIPYCIAVLMHEPEPGPNWYTEEKLRDPKILKLASKVKAKGPFLETRDAFRQFRAGKYPNVSVEVKTKDGKRFKQDVPFPKGHPRNRMTVEELKARFRRAASFALKADKIERAMNLILGLEEVEDVSEIAVLMHG